MFPSEVVVTKRRYTRIEVKTRLRDRHPLTDCELLVVLSWDKYLLIDTYFRGYVNRIHRLFRNDAYK